MPLYRGYTQEKLIKLGDDFEDLFHLLVLGSYPNAEEREQTRAKLANEIMEVPSAVVEVVRAFPYHLPIYILLLCAFANSGSTTDLIVRQYP